MLLDVSAVLPFVIRAMLRGDHILIIVSAGIVNMVRNASAPNADAPMVLMINVTIAGTIPTATVTIVNPKMRTATMTAMDRKVTRLHFRHLPNKDRDHYSIL